MRVTVPTFVLGCVFLAVPTFAQLCNVWLLGKGLCACYENKHCRPGHGCLTKSCGADSCGFPRVCLCKPNMDSEGKTLPTSNCFPVKTGPCKNCFAEGDLHMDIDKSTPRDALLWEFGTLSPFELRTKAAEAGLSTKGTDADVTARLADLVVEQEAIEA